MQQQQNKMLLQLSELKKGTPNTALENVTQQTYFDMTVKVQ